MTKYKTEIDYYGARVEDIVKKHISEGWALYFVYVQDSKHYLTFVKTV